jgi:adenosylhomocysteinase
MNIQQNFDQYLHIYPDERSGLKQLSEQLKQADDILSRKNFVGHVTSSAFILNENSKQVLLLEHKSLEKLLQPGGHLEETDQSLIDAALREIEEETGLKADDINLRAAMPSSPEVPFDIDTHYIPENKKKVEPAHYHHDFRYLYTTNNSNIEFDPNESNNYKWIDWDDFVESPTFGHITDKINAVLEPNVREYFKALTTEECESLSVLTVAHIIPSSEEYIKSLNENFNLIGIIPKPKSINQSSRNRITNAGVRILDQFTRESINKNTNEFIKLLKSYENICLVDIGGYFSEVAAEIKNALGDKLVGIIEDTENGHQKYENNERTGCAVVSVARSQLKNYEDQLVGQGIGHATETVLRQINTIITYKTCGIIGYGKIGKGIAEYLQQRNIRPRVSDINPIRSIQASCDGAIVCDTEELIRKCDVIFCATGAQALDILKLRDLKKGAYIASATSSDDEFDLKFLESEYEKEIIDPYITRYFKKGHMFHLLNDGNAINFLFSAAVDKYINLVQGEIVFSICRLSTNKNYNDINFNTEKDHQRIARAWLDYVKRSDQLG